MHHVADRLTDDLDAWLHVKHDALILIDLGDRRAEHVDESDWLTPAPALRLMTGKNQEVLGVAAHTSGQVVKAEQAGQPVGVLLGLLQVVDQGELPLDQGLAAAGQVDEHRVQVAAEHGLVGGQPDRLPVDLIEGPGHLTDLVGRVDADRLDFGGSVARVGALAQPAYHLRELASGDLESVGAQLAQRTDHGPRHKGRDQQDDEQQGRGGRGNDDGVVQRGLLKQVGLDRDLVDKAAWATAHRAHVEDLLALGIQPALRRTQVPAGLLRPDLQIRGAGRGEGPCLRALRLVHLLAGDGVVQVLLLGDRSRRVELVSVGGLRRDCLVQACERSWRQDRGRALQSLVEVRTLERGVVLHSQQRVERSDI